MFSPFVEFGGRDAVDGCLLTMYFHDFSIQWHRALDPMAIRSRQAAVLVYPTLPTASPVWTKQEQFRLNSLIRFDENEFAIALISFSRSCACACPCRILNSIRRKQFGCECFLCAIELFSPNCLESCNVVHKHTNTPRYCHRPFQHTISLFGCALYYRGGT